MCRQEEQRAQDRLILAEESREGRSPVCSLLISADRIVEARDLPSAAIEPLFDGNQIPATPHRPPVPALACSAVRRDGNASANPVDEGLMLVMSGRVQARKGADNELLTGGAPSVACSSTGHDQSHSNMI